MIDFEPPITFGKIWCPDCSASTWFVSWDEYKNGPEHAECRDCGYCYGSAEEVVVDPTTHKVTRVTRPILPPDVWNKARAEMAEEFRRELVLADIAHGCPPGTGERRLTKIARDKGLRTFEDNGHGPLSADR